MAIPVLVQVDYTNKLLLALIALVGKCQSVLLHVLLQLTLLLEWRLSRTVGTGQTLARYVVSGEMGVQLADLGESTGTLIAQVLLRLVVSLHVVVQVGHLSKGSAAVVLQADKGSLSGV